MPKAKHCGHCGEKLKPSDSTRFDTVDREAIYHEHCLWGIFARRGWSYLQQPGGSAPQGLRIKCFDCDGELVLGQIPIWYERDFDIGGYRPYHPACAPSKVD